MKKFAIAALMSGAVSVLSLAHAAPVTVDADTYTLTYDDSFLASFSPAVDVLGDAITFAGGPVVATSPGDYQHVAFDSYEHRPFPIVLTAKAGYEITGLSESLAGAYTAAINADDPTATAVAGAGFLSYWMSSDAMQVNTAGGPATYLVSGQTPASDTGEFLFTSGITLGSASGHVKMVATAFSLFADASGAGLSAAALSAYKLNVQTTAVVPEPETLGLALAGLAVAGLSLRRRRDPH